MTSKHTPGPWRKERYGTKNQILGKEESNGSSVVICDLQGSQRNEEISANARLIAAAPAMYEALLKISNTFDDSYSVGCLERSIGDQARAVLAKVDKGNE